MSKRRRKKRAPKRVLALPDLEQAKTAVLNSLTSKSGQRTPPFDAWPTRPPIPALLSPELAAGSPNAGRTPSFPRPPMPSRSTPPTLCRRS